MNEIVKHAESEEANEIKPWFPQQDEPEEAYAMFEIYLALGPNRSLRRMAYSYHVGVHKLKEWSSQWQWVARSALYDKLKMELMRDEVLTDIEIRNEFVAKRKRDLAALTEGAFNDLFRYMENYWVQYQNPDVAKKIRFVSSLNNALNSLLKTTLLNLNTFDKNDLVERAININNVLNLNNDLRRVNIEKGNLYNLYNGMGPGDYLCGEDLQFTGPDGENWEQEVDELEKKRKESQTQEIDEK